MVLRLAFSLTSVLSFAAAESVLDVVDIAPVWSGHPVSFCLLTHLDRQFVAFYDANRQATVAARALDSHEWQFQKLDERVAWDSHNYLTMAVDDAGCLHLSGNMHCVPIVYFRTSQPLDVTTFARIPSMVGQNESEATYPSFMRGASNELLFTYRDGKSGDGNQIYNVYDLETRTWRRLLDQPLTSGEGQMNAYFNGPLRGPDGRFHLCWVWRDTGGCQTNHDLSYARSSDLVHWETSAGEPVALPMTLTTAEIVDPVPAGGGIINGNARLGFDSKNRVVISYHKFDADGNTQIYNARREEDGWKIYPITDWKYRWEFSGGGSIHFEIRVGSVGVHDEGHLAQSWSHDTYGSGIFLLDEATMKPVGEVEKKASYPKEVSGVQSTFEGMQVRWAGDLGSSGEAGVRYSLRWETLGPNRDHPREGELPEPTMLRVYKFGQP
ncbi:MAG TPA: BNR repeat-containing protein [Candidatus Hydrogenedentes bacterium]|nr:BNR repeat-containing protein [Candidatus Hydrogenedentota bacterium]HPG67534.1 BNR repeat-containing protein [Candidatus Hydrogenedentota bacterium]